MIYYRMPSNVNKTMQAVVYYSIIADQQYSDSTVDFPVGEFPQETISYNRRSHKAKTTLKFILEFPGPKNTNDLNSRNMYVCYHDSL